MDNTSLVQNSLSSDASFDSGMMAGGRIGYQINPNWAFELEYIYRRNDIDTITGGAFGAATKGDYASTAVMFNAVYTFDGLEKNLGVFQWKPYVGIGIGVLTEGRY